MKLNKIHAAELEDKIKSIEKYIAKNLENKSLLHQKLLKLEKFNPHGKVFAKVVKQYRNIKSKLHQKFRDDSTFRIDCHKNVGQRAAKENCSYNPSKRSS